MAARKTKAAPKKATMAEEYFVLDHNRGDVLFGPRPTEADALEEALEDGVVGTEDEGYSVTIVKVVGRYATKSEIIKL